MTYALSSPSLPKPAAVSRGCVGSWQSGTLRGRMVSSPVNLRVEEGVAMVTMIHNAVGRGLAGATKLGWRELVVIPLPRLPFWRLGDPFPATLYLLSRLFLVYWHPAVSAFPHQNTVFVLCFFIIIMPRTKGATAIDPATQGAILIAIDEYDKPYSDVARTLGTSRQVVKQMRDRVHAEADKENIPPLQVVNTQRPRSGRPLRLDVRDRRRLVRHATKNKANRRKPWDVIAQECEIQAFNTSNGSLGVRSRWCPCW